MKKLRTVRPAGLMGLFHTPLAGCRWCPACGGALHSQAACSCCAPLQMSAELCNSKLLVQLFSQHILVQSPCLELLSARKPGCEPNLPWYPPSCWGTSHLCLAASIPMQTPVHQCMPAGWDPLLICPALSPQGRPRRPPPSFTSPHPEGHSLGFLLERGRCTATAQAEGGMKIAFVEEAVGRRSRLVFGPAPDAPRSCYTVVQPGLQSGSTYTELLVQSMRPSSRGTSGLRFWVVSLTCPLDC